MIDLKSTPEEFFGTLNNEEKFIKAVEYYYWYNETVPGSGRKEFKAHCPDCYSENVTPLNIKPRLQKSKLQKPRPRRYHCKDCSNRNQFNIFKNTPFYRNKTPLKEWFYCYWYLMKGKASKEISIARNLREREVRSIKSKLLLRDKETKSHYLFDIANEYWEYSRRYTLHRRNQYID
jgi:transposase-like protein